MPVYPGFMRDLALIKCFYAYEALKCTSELKCITCVPPYSSETGCVLRVLVSRFKRKTEHRNRSKKKEATESDENVKVGHTKSPGEAKKNRNTP